MSQILGRVFKHSEKAEARKMFDMMDDDGNGMIDLKELMNGLQTAGMHVAWIMNGWCMDGKCTLHAGLTPKELDDLTAKV